jgi:hypothetical protein
MVAQESVGLSTLIMRRKLLCGESQMKALKIFVRKTPLVREVFGFLFRSKIAFTYLASPLKEAIGWLFRSREFTNFTYDLSDLNKRYLISTIASIVGKSFEEIANYVAELENDRALHTHIQTITKSSEDRFFADIDVFYGRRLGWYAFARAVKPKIVVETGVDKGLGSCILASALIKNAQEGYSGRYYGTDINPLAGYLLRGIYSNYGEILYGDSIESLMRLNEPIDLFINDSDHSAAYEEREYQTIMGKLAPGAIVLSDNAHCTDRLLGFALDTGRKFIFFQEKPLKHWYPGAGIGIAY